MRVFILIAALALGACQKHAPATDDAAAAEMPLPQPSYVGFWASHPSQCDTPQESPDAPIMMTAGGYNQFETHCTFEKVERGAPGEYKIQQSCIVDGDKQRDTLEFKVVGDYMILRPDGQSATLMRCLAG
jgi:hypothetical protein